MILKNKTSVLILPVCLVFAMMFGMTASLSTTPGTPSASTSSSQGQSSSTQIIALVTGSNKGIGYQIAKRLGREKHITCILGCRDMELGKQAIAKLQREDGCDNLDLVRIDLENGDGDADSDGDGDGDNIEVTFKHAVKEIEEKYGRCDVLINNAAVCFNDPTLYGKVPHTPFEQQAEITIRTNFFGTLSLTRAMIPLLKKSSSPRIINIASSAGRLSILPSEKRRNDFSSEQLSLEELGEYMKEFVGDVQDGSHSQKGWPNTGYGVSKVGIIAMTKIFARQYSDFMVNSVDPGYCSTDQNNNQGVVPAERGALTPFLLATVSSDDQFVSGEHFYEEHAISWMYQ